MRPIPPLLLWASILSAVACTPSRGAGPGYSFTLDGEPIQPDVLSLNATPDRPQEGDLIRIDEILLTLGPEGSYDFRTTPDEDGRLLVRTAEGPERVIGVKVGWTYEGDEKVVFDPLSKLDDRDIRGLRGIYLDEWNQSIAGRLKLIAPQRACVTITDNTAQGPGRTMPPLPPTIEYLRVRERSNQGIRDYSGLGAFPALKFLVVRSMTGQVDAGSLGAAGRLQYLDMAGSSLRNIGALAPLKRLRYLGLAHTEGTDTVAFTAGMDALVELDVRGTAVEDLTALGGLRALTVVQADGTPVRSLPRGEAPRLRRLHVMSTALPDEQVAEFAAAHPDCRVWFRWEHALRDALAGVNRVRVRSGGTCHRDVAGEKTLAEVEDAAALARLIEGIRIDEAQSGAHCLCCGSPSFEFYRGGDLVLTLGFHHGQAVRWVGGWPGDGALTEPSADLLAVWLADHGIPGALEQRAAQKKRDAAALRRTQHYEALIPEAVLVGLRAARSREEAIKAFEDGIEDDMGRAVLYLKLFGCDDGSWNRSSGLDDPLKGVLLPSVRAEILAVALGQATDGAAMNGAGRWLFGEERWKSLDEKVQEEVLPGIARRALGHPRPINRRMALAALGRVPGHWAVPLLRSVLASEIEVRPLPRDQEDEPDGMMMARPGDGELIKGSDRAHAGLMLARRGDRESLPAIRKLAERATGEDHEVLREAVALLEEDRGGGP